MIKSKMIDILLSTFNGEKYLQEQIESILTQTHHNWNLLIRDDGSHDKTVDIIKKYCALYPNKFFFINNNTENLGVIKSFEYLLNESTSEYIMFCDQDDIWLPNKIKISLKKIIEMEFEFGNVPLLVHTDLLVVNRELSTIHNSFWKFSYINPHIVDKNIYYMGMSNSVTGCSLIMNRKAKEVSLPFHKNVLMHDAWIALCVMKYGYIDYITTPTIKYRQHEGNVLGAIEYKFSVWEKLQTIKKVYNENKGKYLNAHPLIYKNILHYLYHKVKFTYIIHYKQKKLDKQTNHTKS